MSCVPSPKPVDARAVDLFLGMECAALCEILPIIMESLQLVQLNTCTSMEIIQ